MLILCTSEMAGAEAHTTFFATKRILFIGNSLTYVNDLPAIVTRLAGEKGIVIITETLAFPNYALEDHWNDGNIQKRIKEGKFDFVVVQQGPSSQEEGRLMLLNYGAKIKELCSKYKAQLAFFVVWPSYANLNGFDNVIKNYTDAATNTSSLLCPVGNAWQKHFSETKDYSYYGADLFHPSEKGSIVAGEIIVNTLFAGYSR
ncbi:MAG: hypothetical protein ABIR18_12590 [Chitinophagaceae bacterium]